MNICFFTDVFLPRIDGVSNSIYHLSKQMAENGEQVLVFAPKLEGSDQVDVPGVQLEFLPSLPAFVYPQTRIGLTSPKLIRKIRRFQPDVIHVTTPFSVGLAGLILGKMMKVPVVGAFHGYMMSEEYLELLGIKRMTKTFEKLLWRVTKDFYNKSDLILTPSQYVKQDLIDHKFTKPIRVIHNAAEILKGKIDERFFQQFVSEHQIDQQAPTVLYIGRLSTEKNLFSLIDVFELVQARLPQAQLVLIGDGPRRSDIEKLISERGLRNCFVTGAVEHSQLLQAGLYRLGDVFVTCSQSEVQPMSIIEALNFGLPVAAVKARGVGEMVQDNGFLVEPGQVEPMAQELFKILTDKKLREKMSLRSEEMAKQYDLETVARKHVQTYQDLIKSS